MTVYNVQNVISLKLQKLHRKLGAGPRELYSRSFKTDLNSHRVTKSDRCKSFCTSLQDEGAANWKAFLPNSFLTLGTDICKTSCC